MRKPARQGSKLADRGAYTDISYRRLQVQLMQKAKIATGFPSFLGNFCVCGVCQRSDVYKGKRRAGRGSSFAASPANWALQAPPRCNAPASSFRLYEALKRADKPAANGRNTAMPAASAFRKSGGVPTAAAHRLSRWARPAQPLSHTPRLLPVGQGILRVAKRIQRERASQGVSWGSCWRGDCGQQAALRSR